MTAERLKPMCLVLLLGLAAATPNLSGGGSQGTPLRAEAFVMLGLLAASLLSGALGRLGAPGRALYLITFAIIVALLGSSITNPVNTSWNDLFIIVRLGEYWAMFTVAAWLTRSCDAQQQWTVVVGFQLIVATVALIGIAQYLDVLSMNRLTAVYGQVTLLANGLEARRAVGTLGNPNYFGFTCALGSCVAFATLLRRAPRIATLTSTGTLASTIGGMFVSGSRGAVLSATAMATILVGSSLISKFSRTRALTAAALAAVCTGLALGFLDSLPIVNRFSLLTGTANASSNVHTSILTHRAAWGQALEVIRGHEIFGVGPSKHVLVQWVDSDMLRLTREFGLIGLGCYLSLVMWLVWRLTTRLTTHIDEKRWAASLGLALVGGFFVMGLTADVFYNERVMSMIFMLAGLLYGWASIKPAQDVGIT